MSWVRERGFIANRGAATGSWQTMFFEGMTGRSTDIRCCGYLVPGDPGVLIEADIWGRAKFRNLVT